MKVVVEILEILCTLNEGFWIFLLMDVFFERRSYFKRNKNILINNIVPYGPMLLYLVIVTSLNQMTLTSPYTFVIAMILNMVMGCLLWKSDFVMSVSVVGMYGLGLLIKDMIVMLGVGMIGGDELIKKAAYISGIERIYILLICGGTWFVANLLFYVIIRKKYKNKNDFRYLAIVCIVSYIGLLFIAVQILNNFVEKLNGVMFTAVAIIAACIIVPYFMIKYKDIVNQLKIVESRNELLTKNYDSISEYYSANAKLYHDMKHHFNVVNHMLTEGENEEAKKYIQSLGESAEKYSKTTYTGIDIIDVILSDKENCARSKGVDFHVNAQILPQDMGIDKRDLCTVLANILDNALEASVSIINIKIKMYKRMLIIQVENDYIAELKIKNGQYQTTKKDSMYHGWGLKSVQSVVEKYEGSMECKAKEQNFIVDIIMNF